MAQNRVNRPSPLGADQGAEAGGSGQSGSWLRWIDPRRVGWMRMLLATVPVALVLWAVGASPLWKFLFSGLAIIPLAGMLGEATDQLAHRLGPGIGGLLNATFGNAAELIIALFALSRGLDEVVKASLTGSIIGNLLLVLGASLLAGGIKYPVQRFEKTAAGVGATLMALAAIGLLMPAIFHALVGPREAKLEHELSVAVCFVLVATYGLHLVFSLVTHKNLFNPDAGQKHEDAEADEVWSTRKATIVLLVSTALVALMSEVLVGAVEATGEQLGLTPVFMGVIVVAIVGNAAEHSTAVLMAMKNKMDLAVGIALGSALQIALFVGPVLVFVSYLRQQPMDLLFTTLEVASVILAVAVARMVAEDGESNWLEGAMLLMLYALIGLAFGLLPEQHRSPLGEGPPPPAVSAGDGGSTTGGG